MARTEKNERNYGIDALKLASMLLIVLLHVLGQGGVLGACQPGSWRYHAAWLLEIAGYCSVGCFALASGYVQYGRVPKPERLMMLWLQVVFYGLAACVLFRIFLPGAVRPADIVCALFPVVTKQYWYFTAYFGLFFLMPVILHVLNTMDERAQRRLSAALLALFCGLPTLQLARIFFPSLPHTDVFVTNNGYSLIWLAALFYLGGRMRKTAFFAKKSAGTWLLLCLGAIAVTWLSQIAIRALTFRLHGQSIDEDFFIRFTSPTVLAASVCLMGFFARLRVGDAAARVLKALSPLSFGVYLVHVQPLVWEHVMKGRFAALAEKPLAAMVLCILSAALAIFLLALAADAVRQLLFRALRVERACKALCKKLER